MTLRLKKLKKKVVQDVADAKEWLTPKIPKLGIPRKDMLSTGSTLLNLACSDRIWGGFAKGHYYWLVGDSTSGKTFLSLTCFAEAAKNKHFKNHRFIFDNVEEGALMNLRRFFGPEAANRIEPPSEDAFGGAVNSKTIEDFYDHVDDANKDGRPYIYVLDSHDSLDSEQSEKKFKEAKALRRKGKVFTGEMTDGKAKKNSGNLRKLIRPLSKSGSILIIISQTRDNMGFTAKFNPKTVSGGRALKFYATVEIWSKVRGQIRKAVRGKKRQIGIVCCVNTKKNRITGKDREVEIPIFSSYGFDDIGSCIDYLVMEGEWTSPGKKRDGPANPNPKINAPHFDFAGRKDELIRKIEEEDLGEELREIVGTVWREIEEACVLVRKPRYG